MPYDREWLGHIGVTEGVIKVAIRQTRYTYANQFEDGVAVKSSDAEEYLEQNFLHYIDINPNHWRQAEGKYFFDSVEHELGEYKITFHVIQDLCGECDANGVHSFDECTDSEHALTEEVRYEVIYLAQQVDIFTGV